MAQISKEYAYALFELAKETANEKEYSDSLNYILHQFNQNPEYTDLLSCPNIPMDERKSLLEKVFEEKVPEHVLSFTELLCEKGHIRNFSECVKEYDELYKALELISNAKIVSAVELTEDEKKMLIKKLEKLSGNKISASYSIDSSLIGGIIVYMDDKIIDASVKSKLKEVKEVIGK